MVTEGKKRVRKSPEERKREIIAAAGKLIGEILDYLGVEKEYTADEAALADLQTPKVTGMTPADAEAALEKKGLDSRTVGELSLIHI